MPQSSWTVPLKTFDAQDLGASGQTLGSIIDLRDVFADLVAQVKVTYAVGDAWRVGLYASLDGADWFEVSGVPNGEPWYMASPGAEAAASLTAEHVFSLTPARYVRGWANHISGAPDVTLWLAAR